MLKNIYRLPNGIVDYIKKSNINVVDIDGLYDIDIAHIKNMSKCIKKTNEKVKKFVDETYNGNFVNDRFSLYAWILLNNLNYLRYKIHQSETPVYKFTMHRKIYRSIVYKYKSMFNIIDTIFINDTTYIINRKYYRLKRVEGDIPDNYTHLEDGYYLVRKDS